MRQTAIAPAHLFLLLALFFGTLFLVATPPLRFPDEPGHFLRAARTSAELFDGIGQPPVGKACLADGVGRDFEHFLARIREVMTGKPFSVEEIARRVANSPGTADCSMELPIPTGQMLYNGIAQVPQAIAIRIAKIFGGGFLLQLLSARLSVLIVSTALTMLAIHMMPKWAQWTSAVVSLFPMAVYLRGSVAPDAFANAAALIGIAAFLRGFRDDGLLRSWPVPLAALCACTFLALVKPPYDSIYLLGLLWLRGQTEGRKFAIRAAALLVIAAVALTTALWQTRGVEPFVAVLHPDVPGKLRMLSQTPGAVLAMLWHTLAAIPGMAYSTIARFGWNDINPHPLLHVVAIAWCAWIGYLDRRQLTENVSLGASLLLIGVFAIQVVLVAIALWLTLTEPSSPMIVGLTGRYFVSSLPCAALGGLALVLRAMPGSSKDGTARIAGWVAGGACVVLGWSLIAIVAAEFFGIDEFNAPCLHPLCAPPPRP